MNIAIYLERKTSFLLKKHLLELMSYFYSCDTE